MDVDSENWYKDKLTALLGMLFGIVVALSGYIHYDSSSEYQPLPQQVFLNPYNQPIGEQDLLKDATHNPQYRKTKKEGETAHDYLKDFLLSTFTYNKNDLESGKVLDDFLLWCSEDEAIELYSDVFVNLGQQRIVVAQDGLVRARIIGDLSYVGGAKRPYVSTSGIELNSLTHKFEGKMIITVHGEKLYPTVYTVTALVQRALIQDKIAGYQVVSLELR